jgi:uncharacterized protein YkwD
MSAARTIAFAAVVFVAQSCGQTASIAPPPPPPDPHTLMPDLELRIFQLVQDERHKIDPGAKMLMPDTELIGAARAHSIDMADRNYIAHVSPNGETTTDLIMNTDASFEGIVGENIAAEHFVVGYAIDVDELAHRFVATWLASHSHRDNLAFSAFDKSGVGAAVNGDTIYVTQLFATDLGLKAPALDPASHAVAVPPNSAKAGTASPVPK